MTEITDQELRDAIEWGRRNEYSGDPAEANAAIVILATVDAPAPALAEELRSWAEDASYDEDRDNLLHAADRADQMEHDLAEARNKVERLKRDLAEAYETRDARDDEVDSLRAEVERLAAERDQSQSELAEVTNARDSLREEFDHARTEVERLTAERDRLEAAQYLPDGSAWGGPVREPTVQKGAESNAETPNPADVKPGEAWIVECRGERRAAVKDNGIDIPWNTINADGRHVYKRNENVTLITRLVPAPRVITNPDELDALAEGAIVRDFADGEALQKIDGMWIAARRVRSAGYHSGRITPVTVLWEPVVRLA